MNEISRLNYSYITNQVKNDSNHEMRKYLNRNIERLAASHRHVHIEER